MAPFSQAAEDSTSEPITPASSSRGRASKTSMPQRSSTVIGLPSLLPPMCERSTPDSLLSMCSPAGFPARTSRALAAVLGWLTGTVPGSGLSTPEPFAFFDRESLSWRTSQASLLPDSESSWPTWPKRGMTVAGQAYEAQISQPLTDASGSSSLLPTPTANQYEQDNEVLLARREREKAKGRNGNGFGLTTANALALLPTPTTEPMTGNGHARNLGKEVKLLPTPTSRDHKGRNQRDDETCLTGALLPTPRATRGGSATETVRLLPTPVTKNNDNQQTEGKYGPNPGMVLRGEPTSLPSDAGNNSPAPLPGQLTIGDD